MNDICKVGGIFEMKVYKDKDAFSRDEISFQCEHHNIMTNASLAVVTGLVLATGGQTGFTYLELGTGSTAAAATQTALVTPITDSGLARKVADSITFETSSGALTNDRGILTASWTASGSKTITEAGVFNASSSGVMLARALTTSYAAVSGNIVVLTYKWRIVGN